MGPPIHSKELVKFCDFYPHPWPTDYATPSTESVNCSRSQLYFSPIPCNRKTCVKWSEPIRMLDVLEHACNPCTQKENDTWVHWPASLAYLRSSKPVTLLVSKDKMRHSRITTFQVDIWPPYHGKDTHKQKSWNWRNISLWENLPSMPNQKLIPHAMILKGAIQVVQILQSRKIKMGQLWKRKSSKFDLLYLGISVYGRKQVSSSYKIQEGGGNRISRSTALMASNAHCRSA